MSVGPVPGGGQRIARPLQTSTKVVFDLPSVVPLIMVNVNLRKKVGFPKSGHNYKQSIILTCAALILTHREY